MGRTACTEPQCLYNGALYLYLYLYSPMVRTACTEPQCLYNGALYLYLYLYSPMDRTACTEPQCLYNGALYVFFTPWLAEIILNERQISVAYLFFLFYFVTLLIFNEAGVSQAGCASFFKQGKQLIWWTPLIDLFSVPVPRKESVSSRPATRETVYVSRDGEACSCIHFCSGKASILHIPRVCVCSLRYPACNPRAPFVICGLPASTVFFHIIS